MNLVGTKLGDLQIIEELGRGGMATVYKAYQEKLNRYVAVKVLLPSLAQDAKLVQRFLREAETAAALKHPHVITIHDIDSQDDYHYIVVEYLEGLTLAQLLEQEGQLAPERVLHIVQQVADALDHAHRQGFVHRDIKPSNIMVDPACNDHVTLMDFGLVRVIGGSQITRSGTIVGTPDYMSPEQAKGEELDHRADIYSLGVTIYHMLTGIVPFGKPTPHAVMMAHITEEPPSMTSLGQQTPLEVEAVVIKSMAKEPADRYQWAGDLARDLENAITSTALITPPLRSADRGRSVALPQAVTPPLNVASGEPEPTTPPARSKSSPPVQKTQPPTPVSAASPERTRPKWLWPMIGLLAAGLIVVMILTCVVGVPLLGSLLRGRATATYGPVAATSAPAPTATAAPPTAAPQLGAPTYQEDFTAPGDEWEISEGENATYRVEGGVYTIQVYQENWIAWNTIGLEFADFEIVFDVALVDGDIYNDAGTLFRFQDRDNYYELDLNGGGSFAVGKQIDGEWYQILDWTESPAIEPFGSVNRVRLIARGDQFEVIVNGQTIGRFVDDTYQTGGMALVVTAYDAPPAKATFDNLRIWALGP
jgi:serine/threonine protein kinase